MSERVNKIKENIATLKKWPAYKDGEFLNEIDRLTVAYDICEEMLSYNRNLYNEEVSLFKVRTGMDLSKLRDNIKSVIDAYAKMCELSGATVSFSKFIDGFKDDNTVLSNCVLTNKIVNAYGDVFADYKGKFDYENATFCADTHLDLFLSYDEKIVKPLNVLFDVVDFGGLFDIHYKLPVKKSVKQNDVRVDVNRTPIIYDKQLAYEKSKSKREKQAKSKARLSVFCAILTILTCLIGGILCGGGVALIAPIFLEKMVGYLVGAGVGIFCFILFIRCFSDLKSWFEEKLDFCVPTLPELHTFIYPELQKRIFAVRTSYDQIGEIHSEIELYKNITNALNGIINEIPIELRDISITKQQAENYEKLASKSAFKTLDELMKVEREIQARKRENEKYDAQAKEMADILNDIVQTKLAMDRAEREKEREKEREYEEWVRERERDEAINDIRDTLKDLNDKL